MSLRIEEGLGERLDELRRAEPRTGVDRRVQAIQAGVDRLGPTLDQAVGVQEEAGGRMRVIPCG